MFAVVASCGGDSPQVGAGLAIRRTLPLRGEPAPVTAPHSAAVRLQGYRVALGTGKSPYERFQWKLRWQNRSGTRNESNDGAKPVTPLKNYGGVSVAVAPMLAGAAMERRTPTTTREATMHMRRIALVGFVSLVAACSAESPTAPSVLAPDEMQLNETATPPAESNSGGTNVAPAGSGLFGSGH